MTCLLPSQTAPTLAGIFLLVVAGCSSEPIGTVTGRVTVDGQPLQGASVIFHRPETGVAVTGNLAEDGAYRIRTGQHDGLPPGEYVVTLAPGIIGTGDPMLVGSADAGKQFPPPPIPDDYQTVETSPLRATVEQGENRPYLFDLTAE